MQDQPVYVQDETVNEMNLCAGLNRVQFKPVQRVQIVHNKCSQNQPMHRFQSVHNYCSQNKPLHKVQIVHRIIPCIEFNLCTITVHRINLCIELKSCTINVHRIKLCKESNLCIVTVHNRISRGHDGTDFVLVFSKSGKSLHCVLHLFTIRLHTNSLYAVYNRSGIWRDLATAYCYQLVVSAFATLVIHDVNVVTMEHAEPT